MNLGSPQLHRRAGRSGSPRHQSTLLHQPDTLKMTATLAVLKHLHNVANAIDDKFGDKASEKTYFVSGVQGRISKPNWNRDYTYFLAQINEVRLHLLQFCVKSALNDLQVVALDIFNRFDNRRRMGVEIIVLAMLSNKNSGWFEVPDKYHSPDFVIEMLVSCKHRFQKPEKCYFWSRQTEYLLTSTFASSRNLTKVRLAISNDSFLRALAVNCRKLQELELQLAMDVSEEGLFALAGKSSSERDLGNPKPWIKTNSLNKDFGQPKDWFIKDSLLFTPKLNDSKSQANEKEMRELTPKKMPALFDTGFGCLELVKLRINGDFIFPPMMKKVKLMRSDSKTKLMKGPILEYGFYALMSNLDKLKTFIMNGLPLVIANAFCYKPELSLNLGLKSLTLERELMEKTELTFLSSMCRNITELHNVTAFCSADWEELAQALPFQNQLYNQRFYSSLVCEFLQSFQRLTRIQGRIPLPCFISYLIVRGNCLTKLHLSTRIVRLKEICLFRKHAPNLEVLEGKFVQVENNFDMMEFTNATRIEHYRKHDVEKFYLMNSYYDKVPGEFSQELKELLSEYPMSKLTKIDIEASITSVGFQLFVGNVENLEYLHFTNIPDRFAHPNGKALSDEWIDALLHVNRLTSIKDLTLRLDSEATVEAGSFSERGLHKLLLHCVDYSPKLTNLVGEFTKIADSKLKSKNKQFVEKGLRRLKIKNAVPYRRFDNMHDNERYYAVNEGYLKLIQEQQGHQLFQSQQERKQANRRFSGYVFRPFPKPNNVSSSDDESEEE